MPFLLGTDEAGYGPNLGPLVVSGTLWRHQGTSNDLYEALKEVVTAAPPSDEMIWIADSKAVYRSKQSIEPLETGVLAMAQWCFGQPICSLVQLLNRVSPGGLQDSAYSEPWCDPAKLKLPLESTSEKISELVSRLRDAGASRKVKLQGVRSRVVMPGGFNRLVSSLGNKANVLSKVTLQLAAELKNETQGGLEIVCDKHGGRSKYAALVQHHLTDSFVEVGSETRQVSEYRFREPERDVRIDFKTSGECFLPTALASMVSKYLRELFMLIWNDYWTSEVVGIRPTKGYPVDAKRFKREIASAQRRLGIEDQVIWRCR